MSSGPQLVRTPPVQERNWLPLILAAVLVVAVLIVLIAVFSRGKTGSTVTPVSAPLDPYAASLTISGIQMSQSAIMAGGKVTYLDGHIQNNGNRTISGIDVQVIFRDVARQVAWNETQPLKIIRTRDPYIDVEPLSASPLVPGHQADFRLIFDTVPDAWDGAYPDIRIIHVDFR